MTRHEKTSARVARIAARVLTMDLPDLSRLTVSQWRALWSEIQALAASALTQAEGKRPSGPATIKKRPSSWPPSANPPRRGM